MASIRPGPSRSRSRRRCDFCDFVLGEGTIGDDRCGYPEHGSPVVPDDVTYGICRRDAGGRVGELFSCMQRTQVLKMQPDRPEVTPQHLFVTLSPLRASSYREGRSSLLRLSPGHERRGHLRPRPDHWSPDHWSNVTKERR